MPKLAVPSSLRMASPPPAERVVQFSRRLSIVATDAFHWVRAVSWLSGGVVAAIAAVGWDVVI